MTALAFGDVVGSRDNNIRIMRFLAAAAVIVSHGGIVTTGSFEGGYDPFWELFGNGVGELAVNLFFVTSGLLVTRSLLLRRDTLDYILSRVLRITPALTVAVVLSAFVLGPLVTELPLREYFTTRWLYSYVIIDSLSISPFHQRFALPGVFSELPYPNVVNAPLWSLPWEIWMYAMVLALFYLRLLGRWLPLVFVPVLLGYMAVSLALIETGDNAALALRLAAYFLAGACWATHGARIRLSGRVAILLTVVELCFYQITSSTALLPLWLSYIVVYLGYAPAMVISRLSHGPDYSYGLYIYGYMVQQTLVWWWGPHDPLTNALAALLLTLPLAMASWHFIEEPALMFKQRLRERRRLPAATEALG